MSCFTLDGRVRLSIALALADGGRGPPVPARWESEARTLGMCGAEIDAPPPGTQLRRPDIASSGAGRCRGRRADAEFVFAVHRGIHEVPRVVHILDVF